MNRNEMDICKRLLTPHFEDILTKMVTDVADFQKILPPGSNAHKRHWICRINGVIYRKGGKMMWYGVGHIKSAMRCDCRLSRVVLGESLPTNSFYRRENAHVKKLVDESKKINLSLSDSQAEDILFEKFFNDFCIFEELKLDTPTADIK